MFRRTGLPGAILHPGCRWHGDRELARLVARLVLSSPRALPGPAPSLASPAATMKILSVPLPACRFYALQATLPVPLGELPSPDWLQAWLRPGADVPLQPPEALRSVVRDMLRGFGYRPTGRGKPSSEYLVAAAADGRLGSINAVVDAGNAVSLHSGIPISVVDLDRLLGQPRIVVPPEGAQYVFNQGGQTIDVGGLVCLADDQGPCANAVKDAQRTKTSADTRRILGVLWNPAGSQLEHGQRAAAWLQEVLQRLGGEVSAVPVVCMDGVE